MKRTLIGEGYSSGASTAELSDVHLPTAEQVDVSADVITAPSPEALEFAMDIGSLPVSLLVELPGAVAAGIDQAEAHANDPLASAEDFVVKTGSDKNGKTTRSTYAVMADGSDKRVSASDMLVERGYDPGSYKDHKTEAKTAKKSGESTTGDLASTEIVEAITPSIEAERPISGRRVLDTKKAMAENPDDQELVENLTSGKLSALGTRLSGMKDLRASRKEIISKQREAMKDVVSESKGDVWNARGRRVANWKQNNFVKRVGQRSDKCAELRDKAFDAIDNSNASNPRKALMRLQARRNAWKIAREDVRKTTRESFRTAEKDVTDAKTELERQKGRAKNVRFSPIHRRTTMGGAGSAGLHETWRDSDTDLRRKEEARAADREKRMAALKARQSKRVAVKGARKD